MYRKANGSRGFSFTKLAHAAVPNFFEDASPMIESGLTRYRRDMCYNHQIASPSGNVYALDERAFYVAGVVDSEGMSRKVYRALKKAGILRGDSEEEGKGVVDTYKIGSRFQHQLAVINIVRQRELVGMLFWWEEECMRLKKLEGEERELDEMIKEAKNNMKTENSDDGHDDHEPGAFDDVKKEMLDQLKFARERVRMKKRQLPSQRRPDVENDTDDLHLAFHGRSKSAPQIRSPTGQDLDRPPDYYASRR